MDIDPNAWDEFPKGEVISFTENRIKSLWTSQECADYLGYTKMYFLQSIATKKAFPSEAPCSTRRNKRWIGRQVIEWATGEKI